MVEDDGAILLAHIRSLSVHLGRIVDSEEPAYQCLVGYLRRVEGNLDRFGMAGRAGRDLLVARIIRMAARIAGDGSHDTPGVLLKASSTPQKHPAANVAFSMVIVSLIR